MSPTSPFLDNFLIDAAACWAAHTGRVLSGPWVEYDRQGGEIDPQATALMVEGPCCDRATRLLISDATKAILQKARETLMAYQRLAQPHPPEIGIALDRLREQYPDYSRCGFLIMRFTAAKPYASILAAIDQAARSYGLSYPRADSHDFHSDLLSNVRTYLHGCSFGVACVTEVEEPNANVGLEVGYLMALNKPVLILKDQRSNWPGQSAGLPSFDPHDPEGTIPGQLSKWFEDRVVCPWRG